MKQIITPKLYKGTSVNDEDTRGYFSNKALQVIMYAVTKPNPAIIMIYHQSLYDFNDIKKELDIEENLWYLDHAYGRNSETFKKVSAIKPGIYDAEVGEALINETVPSARLAGRELLDEVTQSYEESGGSNDISRDSIWAIFNKRESALRELFLDRFDMFKHFLVYQGWDINP